MGNRPLKWDAKRLDDHLDLQNRHRGDWNWKRNHQIAMIFPLNDRIHRIKPKHFLSVMPVMLVKLVMSFMSVMSVITFMSVMSVMSLISVMPEMSFMSVMSEMSKMALRTNPLFNHNLKN